MITTGIDLSIGSNIALSNGRGLAMTNGIRVGEHAARTRLRLSGRCDQRRHDRLGQDPPFIATLGTMTAIRGVSLTLTQGIPVSSLPKSFTVIGTGNIAGLPIPVVLMVLLTVVFGFVLARTRLGRHVYATGSNIDAARLSGVDTKAVLVKVYVISGFLAAFAD